MSAGLGTGVGVGVSGASASCHLRASEDSRVWKSCSCLPHPKKTLEAEKIKGGNEGAFTGNGDSGAACSHLTLTPPSTSGISLALE